MASYIRTKYLSLTLFNRTIIKVSLLYLWPCLIPCVPDEKVTPSDSCWWYYCELWESSECPLSPMQPKKIYFHSMSEDGEVKFNHSFLLYRTQCVWHDMWGLPLFLQQQSCLTHLQWTQASLFQLVILNKIILDPDQKVEAFWWKSTSKLDQIKNMNKKNYLAFLVIFSSGQTVCNKSWKTPVKRKESQDLKIGNKVLLLVLTQV